MYYYQERYWPYETESIRKAGSVLSSHKPLESEGKYLYLNAKEVQTLSDVAIWTEVQGSQLGAVKD